MPENTTTPAIPHGELLFDTAQRGLIRAFVLGPKQVGEPTLHTGHVIVERQDVPEGDPHRFAVVGISSHDDGRTWVAENCRYDLSYNDAVRRLIQRLTRLIPIIPDWWINRPRATETDENKQ